MISTLFDIDGKNYVLESSARKLFATNLFAARNIVKPYDWEAYESAQSASTTAPAVQYVKALYDYTGSNDLELTFTEGTQMQLLEKVDSDWWWCDLNDKQGYVPSTYVEVVKAPPKKAKLSTFTTIKRGTEIEALMCSLLKLVPKSTDSSQSDKIPKDFFLQWALDHEMDKCLNTLEKEFDLRPPKASEVKETPAPTPASTSTTQTTASTSTPAPVTPASPTSTAANPTQNSTQTPPSPSSTNSATTSAPPMSTPALSHSTPMASPNEPAAQSMKSPGERENAPKISPELALILRAAGIADKELDDAAMSEFVNYFIEKHAPKAPGQASKTAGKKTTKKAGAGARKSKIDDTVHRRPLPSLSEAASSSTSVPVAAPTPPPGSTSGTPSKVNLHEQIKAGKKLRPSRKKTNLTTLSKKDLTGLGLLLRTQIDSRRNIMMMSDDEESSSNSDFDD